MPWCPGMRPFLKKMLPRLVLSLIALILALDAAELVVRRLRPDLRNLVRNPNAAPHPTRLFANEPGSRNLRERPDVPALSPVIHNRLGFRQHREFTDRKAPGTIRVGVFGDSFTENIRMPVQYSFTEPLDYLVNRTGARGEVLNFGVDGYSPDQIYIQYLEDGTRLDLDAVVYMYFEKDLQELMEHGLVTVGPDGRPVIHPPPERGPVFRLMKRLHLTYFVIEKLDALRIRRYASLSEESDPSSPKFAEALRRFKAVVLDIQRRTGERGQKFLVALVPRNEAHNARMEAYLKEWGVDVLNLYPDFKKAGPDMAGFFFENDGHWNEEGNKMAAVFLFQRLAERLGIAFDGDAFIRRVLYEYYSSFDRTPIRETWLDAAEVPAAVRRHIFFNYLDLELRALLGPREEAGAMASRVEQALRSNRRIATYVCRLADNLADIGRPQEADACRRALVRVVPPNPDDNDLYYRSVLLYYDMDPARPARDADAHLRIGIALAALGREAEAIQHCEQALKLEPDSALALHNLAWSLATAKSADLRDPARAVELAGTVVKQSPSDPYELNVLAVAYAAAGRTNEAVDIWRRALDLAVKSRDMTAEHRVRSAMESRGSGR